MISIGIGNRSIDCIIIGECALNDRSIAQRSGKTQK